MSKTVTAILALWIAATSIVSGILLSRHLAPLPAPRELRPAFATLLSPSAAPKVVAFHVLLGSCRCSEQIARSLATTVRPAGVEEHVVLVDDLGHAFEHELAGKFAIHHTTLAKVTPEFGVEGVPLLLVVGPDRLIRYSGGYTARKQAVITRDRDIIAAVQRGERPAPLPLYGCPSSDDLRSRRSPWWLP